MSGKLILTPVSINIIQMHPHSQSHQSFPSHTPHQTHPSLYEKVVKFDDFLELRRHSDLFGQFTNFINYAKKKVMFVFGPSGCGKRLWVTHLLQKHSIPFEQLSQYELWQSFYGRSEQQEEKGLETRKVIGLRQIINDQLESTVVSKVVVFHEFPRTCTENSDRENHLNFQFKKSFFNKISSSHVKLIFVLHSALYNPSYFPTNHQEVIFLHIKPYGFREMQKIFSHFLSVNKLSLEIPKEDHIQLLRLSTGDVRKLLLDYYWHCMQERSHQRQTENEINKQNQRIGLFHALGKFLYAKRLDVQSKKQRKFKAQQLKVLDPPFYFKPQNLMLRTGAGLRIFEEMLIENYLRRYGSVQDVLEMSELFCHLDSTFPTYVSYRSLKDEDQATSVYNFLLSWGIILNNKHGQSIRNQFCKWNKSTCTFMQKQQNRKKQLIRKYYKLVPIRNLVKLAYMVRRTKLATQCVISHILVSRIFNVTEMGESQMMDQEQENRAQEDALNYMVSESTIEKVMRENYSKQESMNMVLNELIAEQQMEDKSSQSDIDS